MQWELILLLRGAEMGGAEVYRGMTGSLEKGYIGTGRGGEVLLPPGLDRGRVSELTVGLPSTAVA